LSRTSSAAECLVCAPKTPVGITAANRGVGWGTAVRHNAPMLQHCLSKQTLRRRNCRPLECDKPTSDGGERRTYRCRVELPVASAAYGSTSPPLAEPRIERCKIFNCAAGFFGASIAYAARNDLISSTKRGKAGSSSRIKWLRLASDTNRAPRMPAASRLP
jgi:hypothetical protein